MCPFTFEDVDSADSAIYADFCEFIGDKEITLEQSYGLAEEYVRQLKDVDVAEAFDDVLKKNWIGVCKEYLSKPHKGS